LRGDRVKGRDPLGDRAAGVIERRSSFTAVSVSTLRAVHQLLDDEPKILDDPIAPRLLDPATRQRICTRAAQFQTTKAKRLRAHIVIRSRYAEDRLAEAVRRGIGQYVALGAGDDTFACRQPAWARGLRIFEVDHPASQRAKRHRLREARIPVPRNVTFVALDFEHDGLAAGLRRAGFDPGRPAFVSCLGVLVYLSGGAIDAVFRFVASLPPSSEMVFTFARQAGTDADDSRGRDSAAVAAAAAGEPWLTRFEPALLVHQLHRVGFSDVALLTSADIERRYVQDRRDGLRAPRRIRLVRAAV
jgi:methyltransferase (TIGR00027 family)